MASTAFKFFSDPQLALEAVAALRSSGYPAEAIGVLVYKEGNGALHGEAITVGTLPDVGPVAAVGAEVFGLAGAQAEADAGGAIASALGLPEEALGAFAAGLLRGGALVAVRPQEGLPAPQSLLRQFEPASVRIPKQQNEGFTLAERQTSTKAADSQFSGDFRQY